MMLSQAIWLSCMLTVIYAQGGGQWLSSVLSREIAGGQGSFPTHGGAGIGEHFSNGLRNGWDGAPDARHLVIGSPSQVGHSEFSSDINQYVLDGGIGQAGHVQVVDGRLTGLPMPGPRTTLSGFSVSGGGHQLIGDFNHRNSGSDSGLGIGVNTIAHAGSLPVLRVDDSSSIGAIGPQAPIIDISGVGGTVDSHQPSYDDNNNGIGYSDNQGLVLDVGTNGIGDIGNGIGLSSDAVLGVSQAAVGLGHHAIGLNNNDEGSITSGAIAIGRSAIGRAGIGIGTDSIDIGNPGIDSSMINPGTDHGLIKSGFINPRGQHSILDVGAPDVLGQPQQIIDIGQQGQILDGLPGSIIDRNSDDGIDVYGAQTSIIAPQPSFVDPVATGAVPVRPSADKGSNIRVFRIGKPNPPKPQPLPKQPIAPKKPMPIKRQPIPRRKPVHHKPKPVPRKPIQPKPMPIRPKPQPIIRPRPIVLKPNIIRKNIIHKHNIIQPRPIIIYKVKQQKPKMQYRKPMMKHQPYMKPHKKMPKLRNFGYY